MLRRFLAVTATAALTVTLTATGAHAARSVFVDATGDMHRLTFDSEGNVTGSPAPKVSNGDVRRLVARHNARKLVLRSKFVDLARRGAGAAHVFEIKIGAKQRRVLIVEAGEASESGTWRGNTILLNARGKVVECSVEHTLDYGRNVLVAKVPTGCLNSPGSVRLRAHNLWLTRSGKTFGDNPHNQRPEYHRWSEPVAVG